MIILIRFSCCSGSSTAGYQFGHGYWLIGFCDSQWLVRDCASGGHRCGSSGCTCRCGSNWHTICFVHVCNWPNWLGPCVGDWSNGLHGHWRWGWGWGSGNGGYWLIALSPTMSKIKFSSRLAFVAAKSLSSIRLITMSRWLELVVGPMFSQHCNELAERCMFFGSMEL